MKYNNIFIIANILFLYILLYIFYKFGINILFIIFTILEILLLIYNTFKTKNYKLPLLILMFCPFIIYPVPIIGLLNLIFGYSTLLIFKPEKKLSNTFNEFENSKLFNYIFYILIVIYIFIVLQAFYMQSIDKFVPLYFSGLLIDLIIIIVLFNFILSITNKLKLSSIILSFILIILFFVNSMMKHYTFDIFKLSDLLFVPSLGEITNFVGGSVLPLILKIFLPFIIFIILVMLIYKNYSINNKNVKFTLISRILMFISSIFIILVLFFPSQNMNAFMLEYIYRTDLRGDHEADTPSVIYYARYGLLAGIHDNYIENIVYKPSNYNEDELNTLLADSTNESNKLGKPNIIVVFSESFWDVEKLEDFKFSKEITPNFHNLRNKGTFMNLLSPSYGGISANVEFELLTGGSISYYNNGYIPYMQLYNNDNSKRIPSVMNELNKNNYYTKVINSSIKTLYNCDKVYESMDVKERIHLRNIYDEYPTDKELTDIVIDSINKENHDNYFYLVLTMGAHMPYFNKVYDKYDFNVESNYSNSTNSAVLEYAQRIHDADKQLLRLYKYINTLEDDTILVFFGDHLPFLSDENGLNVINEDSYFNTSNNKLNLYRKYNTEGLILTNFESNLESNMDINYNFILPYILNNMDINLSDYYKWLYSSREGLTLSNRYISKVNDELIYTKNIDDISKDTYLLRNKMQYMLFNKNN